MGRRISLHIEDQTVNDLMRFTEEESATKAIRKAIDELIQRERDARIDELYKMAGTFEFDEKWLGQRRRDHPEISS